MITVGIDWGNKVHSVCIVDEQGRVVFEGEIKHTGEAINRLAERLLRRVDGDVEGLAVALEVPHGAVVETLMDRHIPVFSINPKQLDRFRDRYSVPGAKDDRLDALVLADTLRTDVNRYRRVHLMEASKVEMREMSRLYDTLTKQVVALGSQIYHQLQRYMPSYWSLGMWHEAPWLWDLFEAAPTPRAAQALRQAKVKAILKKHRIRKVTPPQVLRALQDPTPLTVAPGVAEAASTHILMLLPLLRAAHQQRHACERKLQRMLCPPPPKAEAPVSKTNDDNGHPEAQLLLSLPGMGTRIGPVMLTEAHQALYHRDYHALRRLAGVAPVSIRTGGRWKKPRVVRRRACSDRLRNAVYHWANAAVRRDPRCKAHYRALRGRGASHGRALRGVGDRLLKLMVAVLSSGKPFDAAVWNRKTTKEAAIKN